MSSTARPFFGPTCPSGSTWYACATGLNFVGCCASNPCATTCPQGNLYPASFNTTFYGLVPDAQCGSLSKFYTCSFTNPPFMGCCKVNACGSGCTGENLAPAYLDNDGLRSAYGAVGRTSSTSSIRVTSTSVARASSTLSTTTMTIASRTSLAASATRDAASTVVPKKDGPPVAAIAGGAAGGAFALALIIGLLIYYLCYAKKSRKGREDAVNHRQSDLPAMAVAQEKEKGMHSPDAPPVYASPNPNEYYGHHAGQYNHQYSQHKFAPEPQELPIEPQSQAYFSHKAAVIHQRNLSELSGDTAIRSELETPHGTPHVHSNFETYLPSPQGQTHTGWQSPSSAQSGSNWVAHQSWQSQSGPEHSHGPTHGLGLLGTGDNAAHVPRH